MTAARNAAILAVLAVATTAYLRSTRNAAPIRITVMVDENHQTMDGFGTGLGDSDPTLITDHLADLLWDAEKGIGLSILRVMIDPDGQPHRDAGDFAKTGGWDLWGHPHKALARNPALRVIAVGVSPPAAWKDNRSTDHGGSLCAAAGQGLCDASHYDDWAAALAHFVTVAASQKPAVPIYAISAQNEPDFAAPYHSCLYSPEQMRHFITVLGPALSRLDPKPRLMAPELFDWSNLPRYLAAIEADDRARRATDIYAVHQYTHARAPAAPPSGRPLWQTEMSGLAGGPEARWDPTIADGIAVAEWIHSAVVDGNVTAWVWWRALNEWGSGSPPAAADNEDLIVDVSGGLTTRATIAKRLYTLGNFSKFVRPGSVRVGIAGHIPPKVFVSAYKDTHGRVIVVAINASASATEFAASVSGARPLSAVVPWITSAADNLDAKAAVAITGGAFHYLLPARSVTTFLSN